MKKTTINLKPGMKIYELNLLDGQLISYTFNRNSNSRKFYTKPNCLYVIALNERNYFKKLKRYLSSQSKNKAS